MLTGEMKQEATSLVTIQNLTPIFFNILYSLLRVNHKIPLKLIIWNGLIKHYAICVGHLEGTRVNSLQIDFLILLSQEAKANPQVGKVLVNLSCCDLN